MLVNKNSQSNKLYLLLVDMNSKILQKFSISYTLPTVLRQSISSYNSNFIYLKTNRKQFTYGFINTVENVKLMYDVFCVFDLS
jgi:hypothetical protein